MDPRPAFIDSHDEIRIGDGYNIILRVYKPRHYSNRLLYYIPVEFYVW